MDYIQKFYNNIKIIINPKPLLKTNYYYKPNYFIKNAKYQQIFKDEFGIFYTKKNYTSTILEEKKEELM